MRWADCGEELKRESLWGCYYHRKGGGRLAITREDAQMQIVPLKTLSKEGEGGKECKYSGTLAEQLAVYEAQN